MNRIKKMVPKKITIVLLIIILFSCIMILMGGSYAFFTFVQKGAKINTVNSATFQVTYGTGSSAINLANAYPMTEIEGKTTTPYTFTLKNNGTVPVKYQVAIVEDSTTTLTRTLLKYTLKRNAEAESTPVFLTSLTIKTGMTLAVGATDSYQLKVWLDQSATNTAQGKLWKGKISITATE